MRNSLVNTFLGILTTSEVHELIDIFKGKGRRRITPFVEEYLLNNSQSGPVVEEDGKHVLLHSDVEVSDEVLEKGNNDVEEQTKNLKGVLFILDSFRRTRKFQNILKGREVLNLYNQASDQSLSRIDKLEGNSVAKSKGILINKKHY